MQCLIFRLVSNILMMISYKWQHQFGINKGLRFPDTLRDWTTNCHLYIYLKDFTQLFIELIVLIAN